MGMKETLNVVETAERLGVSKQTAYRMVQEGRLPSIKIRGSWRIPVDKLDAFIAVNTTDPKPVGGSSVEVDGRKSRLRFFDMRTSGDGSWRLTAKPDVRILVSHKGTPYQLEFLSKTCNGKIIARFAHVADGTTLWMEAIDD